MRCNGVAGMGVMEGCMSVERSRHTWRDCEKVEGDAAAFEMWCRGESRVGR